MKTPISLRLEPNESPKKLSNFKLNNKSQYARNKMKVLISKYKETVLSNAISSKNEDFEREKENEKKKDNSNFVSEGMITEYTEFIEGKTNKSHMKTTFNLLNSSQPKSIYNRYKNFHTRNIRKLTKSNNYSNSKKFSTMESEDDKKAKLNDVNYLKKYFSQYKQANSLYFILDKKAKDYLNNMDAYVHRNLNENTQKITFGLSPFPNIGMNKDFRVKEPINKNVTIYNKNFDRRAIGERYDKHMTELLRLKQLMNTIKEMDKNTKSDYGYRILCNYLAQNGIFEHKYYTKKYLRNFKDFLKINFDINPKVPYKECLFDILNGDYDQYVENPMDSINQSILSSKPRERFLKNNLKELNTINNNLYLQKIYFTQPTISDIKKKNTKNYMDTLQSSTSLSFEKLENFDEIKKRGKLLEFICYNKQKKKNMLNNCLKRVETNEK